MTVVLTYENGELVKAEKRGNGLVGEVITNNAKTFKNIPISIPYKGRLTLRGEAIIKYSDFEQINREIEDADIIRANCLMYGAAVLCLVICVIIRYLLVG